jgi:hypothetical protein
MHRVPGCAVPRAVPADLEPLVEACERGDLAAVERAWSAALLPRLLALDRHALCHPLLAAVHHLRLDVVQFLCDEVRMQRWGCARAELWVVVTAAPPRPPHPTVVRTSHTPRLGPWMLVWRAWMAGLAPRSRSTREVRA